MKRRLFNLLAFAVIALMTATSCKDYEDEISDLRVEITELRQKIEDINSSIAEGNSIKSVTPVSNGIIITLSNNESYTITNGQAGQSGAPGSVVSIGSNGNWFIDGVDTGNPSRGTDGVVGGYYYPHEDGFWYKVEGVVEEKTDQSWLVSGNNLTAVYANGSVTLHNVEGIDGPVTLGQAILSYLTLIPDFVTENNTPVVNFSSLTTECSELAPVTRIRYRVSPKNASVESIDTENIYFEYNNPTVVETRSAEIDPKASFVSLEDGILTVEIDINADRLEKEDSGKIDQVMLMVPLKNGDEVNSDWAKVISTAMSSQTLALVRTPKANEGDAWSTMKLTETVVETKAVDKNDPRIVEIQYGKTVDLSEVVQTMITLGEWSIYNINTYNLEVAFDLNDESGNLINNKSSGDVDQQQYISLDGSVVTSLVYEVDGASPAVIDRNPIIHVFLKSKDGSFDCNVIEGFIKLNMVEDQIASVPPVTFSSEQAVSASCEEFTMRIPKDQMESEFYSKSELTGSQFHNLFVWTEKSEGIGSISQVNDLDDPGSFNLVWTVASDDLWNNLNSSISKSGSYTFGSNVIDVTFTANVAEQATLDLSGLLVANMWFNNNSNIEHNVFMPELNINDAFKSTTARLLDLGSIDASYSNYNYEYIFDSTQPLTTVDGITITVSDDNKQILANDGSGEQVILTLLPQESGKGDIIKFNSDSELANTLLASETEILQAKIKLAVVNECGRSVLIDAFSEGDTFLIHFFIAIDSGTVYVVPNGTGTGSSWDDPMGDIQAAIDKATEGNDVFIRGGTYKLSSPILAKANVNVYGSFMGSESSIDDRALTTGGNPWDFVSPTVLDGQNQTRVLEIRVASTVDGLTIINGNGVSNVSSGRAGGVDMNGDDAVIQNSIIRDNTATSNGGGMHILRGVIRRCLIENNSTPSESTSARGGGIYVNSYHKVLIEENTIRGNFSYQGGGIRAQHPGTTEIGTVILKNRIYNNTSSSAGAALSLTAAKNELINNLVYNNESTTNGAATVIAGGKVINNSFVNNIGHVLFSISTNPYEFINNIDFGNTAVIYGAHSNENLQFYNNATTLHPTVIEEHSWKSADNVLLNAADIVFKNNVTFAGTPKTSGQESELENIDLSLITSSPALNVGKAVTDVTDDIVGTSRPQGGAYDIGAYELAQ